MAPATCDPETEQLRIELEECLLDGLVFIAGTAVLKDPQGYRVAKKVAKVILGYPPVPLKILGYTSKPIGLLTSGHCVSLALQRARAVRRALEELGCRNNSAAKGMGHMDNLGARIEVVPCTDKEVEAMEGEVAAEEAETEGAVRVQEDLRERLQKACVTFEADSAQLTLRGQQTVRELADVLSSHPNVIFRIIGYAEAQTPTELMSRRSAGVRNSLLAAGFAGKLVSGPAFVELPPGGGTRFEMDIAEEVSDNLSALLHGMITRKKRTGFEIVFEAPAGLQRTFFNCKPLGLSYQNDSPLVVTKVHPHGQAKVLGVQVGWEVRMIASRHVSHLDFTEVQEILASALGELPTAPGSPDNSELRHLKPISPCRSASAPRVDETGDHSYNGSAATRSHLYKETGSLTSATVDF